MDQVIVADNQEVYLAGLVELVSSSDEFRIVRQVSDWREVRRAIMAHRDSVVVAAISLIPTVEQLVARGREARSRILVIAEDSDSPQRYRSSGVAGIVQRSTSPRLFMDTLRKLRLGTKFVRPAYRPPHEDRVGVRAADSLTLGEMRVAALLMMGLKNRLIAERLGMTERVVRDRFHRIFDKTGLSTRLELALFISSHRAFASAIADTFSRIEGKRSPGLTSVSRQSRLQG